MAVFHQEFIAQTPYRSVTSVPLRPDAGPPVGALDLYSTAEVADRMLVSVAVGMLMERTRMHNLDALAVLRGYAFTHPMTLDDVAVSLTGRNLPIDELVNQPPVRPSDPSTPA